MIKYIDLLIIFLLIILLLLSNKSKEYFNFKKKIVVVEPRDHKNMLSLIKNIIEFKPDDWDIQVFIGKNMNIDKLPKNDKNNKKIIYTRLDKDNLFANDYNNLFKSKEFWNQIDAEYIQIMQTDSALSKNSKLNLDDFTKFPYIGCSSWLKAWSTPNHNVTDKNEISCLGVGGFSMRQKSVMLECIDKSKEMLFTGNKNELTDKSPITGGEDFFFSRCIAKLKYNIPTENDMINYCIEYNYKNNSDVPVGIHTSQISKKTANWLLNKCPEGKFTIDDILNKN